MNGNIGADIIHGDEDDDRIHGGKGNDQIFGDAGNDTIFGDLGNDILTGGTGADIFVFKANSGNDTITDFEQGIDKIEITSTVIATTSAAVAAFSGGILDLGNGNTVEITGITSLNEGDFVS